MAVRLEFISILIPMEHIARAYPGGITAYLSSGRSAENDGTLAREGAMDPYTAQVMVEEWENMGLTSTIEKNGLNYWQDICVVDFMRGPTQPCVWLRYDRAARTAEYRPVRENLR